MPFRSILFFVFAGAAVVLSVVASVSVAGPDTETWYRNLWRSVTRGPFAERDVYTARGWRLRNFAFVLIVLAVLATLLP